MSSLLLHLRDCVTYFALHIRDYYAMWYADSVQVLCGPSRILGEHPRCEILSDYLDISKILGSLDRVYISAQAASISIIPVQYAARGGDTVFATPFSS